MLNALKRFRHEQQMSARRRWSEPIDTLRRRIGAWASLFLFDHGIVRPWYWNSARVTPLLWRGPQPNPFHIAWLAKRGIRTVVNLRGPTEYGSYALEREACAKNDLALENAVLGSRSAPRREQIHEFKAVMDRITYPALFHCKSGADRAGLAVALYLILRDGRPVTDAKHALTLRFGHVRAGKTGVLDAFFDQYLADTAEEPMDFLTWVDTVYDPDRLDHSFHSSKWGDVLVDRILRRE